MWLLFLGPLVLGVLLFVVMRALTMAPGRRLQARFIAMGQLAGRTKAEIVATVGEPDAQTAMAGGKCLCQWLASGYHIALIFNGDICEGVSHEFAAR